MMRSPSLRRTACILLWSLALLLRVEALRLAEYATEKLTRAVMTNEWDHALLAHSSYVCLSVLLYLGISE